MQQTVKQLLLFIVIAILFFLLFSGLIISSASGKSTNSVSLTNAALNALAASQQIKKYEEDITIEFDEKAQGDIVASGGDVTIKGEVYGDVTVLYGNIILKSSALVYGHVMTYEGEIFESPGAKIAGDLLEIYNGRTKYTKRRDMSGINKEMTRFTRKSRIRRNETIEGNLIIQSGDVSIYGVVNGDVILLDGDVRIKSDGIVIGHVITANGRTYIAEGGRATGELITFDLNRFEKRHQREERTTWNDEDKELGEKIEQRYLDRNTTKDEGIFRFFGNVSVDKNEIIEGHVVVMKGTIDLDGEVEGDVVAIFGNINLGANSYVDGDVVSVGGKINREQGSNVTGDVVETTLTGYKIRNKQENNIRKKRTIYRKEWHRERHHNMGVFIPFENDYEEPFIFRYNRVEGAYVGIQIPQKNLWEQNRHHLAIYGELGYGFACEEPRFRVGLERWFFDEARITFGGQIYDLTETQDHWLMPEKNMENTLSAIFLKEDFNDFYQRQGYSGYVRQNLSNSLQVGAEYRTDTFKSMPNKTNWAIFGGHKNFLPNPEIDPITEMNSLSVRGVLDTRNSRSNTTQGWFINFEGIFAGERFQNIGTLNSSGTPIDFDRYILDIRRYQPIGYGENLDIRLRAGTSRGFLPIQYQFDMGGYSSLRGFEYKYFQNQNRMLLANLEYRIHGHRSALNDIWLFENFNLILFADAGLAWQAEEDLDQAPLSAQDGFSHLTWNDLESNIGFAISDTDGNARLNIAKRTDTKKAPVVVTFRLNRAF